MNFLVSIPVSFLRPRNSSKNFALPLPRMSTPQGSGVMPDGTSRFSVVKDGAAYVA